MASNTFESPSHDPGKVYSNTYSNSPIPVDSEPKNYPEVVQGPRPGTLPPAPTSNYDPNGAAYPYDAQWTDEQPAEGQKRSTIFGMGRAIFLTALIAFIIIVVLIGIIGGMASGGIKTPSSHHSGNSSHVTVTVSGTPTSTTAPKVTTTTVPTNAGDVSVECPSADGVSYTATGTSKVFKRECNINFVGGDGDLGLQNSTVLSTQQCIDLCSTIPDCVGVNFNYKPECWLKQYIGIKSSGDGMESAFLLQ